MVLPSEPEFEQVLKEITTTLQPFLKRNPEYQRALDVVQIPERVIQFRVTWEDDKGKVQVNRGYRVQFNSAIGPYKGGLRLHPSVNLSILKFLGFEQIFKNALTGLNMGGGKGGSDFDPKGKSDNEIRKFCYAFMGELSRHIGQDTDVPAGDIGVGGREVAYLFGAYKKIRNEWSGILTGKGGDFGGSYIRPEATGYGLIYYVAKMLETQKELASFKGARVLVSGSGNVAQYAALKLIELGAIVLSLSDSTGALIARNEHEGFTTRDIEQIAEIKLKHQSLTSFNIQANANESRFVWHAGARPWTLVQNVDIALPCATQNEVSGEEATALIASGTKLVAEGSNMGCTLEAIEVFEVGRRTGKGIWYAPGKASNCGGVAVSGLEMAQNSARLKWTPEEVDNKLKNIMETAYANSYEVGKQYSSENLGEGALPSLVVGANIAGFVKVADAMRAQGDWW
ncbi:NADP-specific glutamate dehydrogenase [Cantharellus anzutake]|uniref:NADP-specific glutamate dehydrogenase n=1 Tax=Cantharellus anzutake TaxID=1750568 RepID=UPI0019085371|nr:NADP-specific glutamate dehydrogenase [Cantharellus anzutake]KAF8336579.1 NADP-specific glutamate dehydrogenase [Cantharellus anzutake]